MLSKLAPLLFILLFIGCSNKVVLDLTNNEGREVFLVDYGYHSSLVLESDRGEFWEYTFGDWEWFAKDRTGWWRLPKTLFWPTRSTLARAFFEDRDSFLTNRNRFKVEIYEFYADPLKTEELISDINTMFENNIIERPHYQARYDLYFVPLDSKRYHLFRNCNHFINQWLEELGHEVRGGRVFSSWEILD